MIRSFCQTCFQPFTIQTLPGRDNLALLHQTMDKDGFGPCPRLCGGKINLTNNEAIEKLMTSVKLRDPLNLTLTQYYQAANGLGCPDEIPKDADILQPLLKSAQVEGMVMDIAPGGLYIHEIHFDNGFVLHLTAGSKGAMVLKVTKSWPTKSQQKPSPELSTS